MIVHTCFWCINQVVDQGLTCESCRAKKERAYRRAEELGITSYAVIVKMVLDEIYGPKTQTYT